MTVSKEYRKKLDSEGNPIIENGDFVMELVSETNSGVESEKTPNYYGLEQGLFKSSIFGKYFSNYNTKGLFFKSVMDNGKFGFDPTESHLIQGLMAMEIPFTQSEKDFINNVFRQNNFSVQLP